MKKSTLLVVGALCLAPSVIAGLVLRSWDVFVLACLATGVALLIGSTMLIHGEASPRRPEENLRQMKANQYGYVAGVELPTDARSWRSVLVCLPALAVGVVAVLILAATR